MKKYLLKRILLIIPILIAVTIAIFFLLSLSPGDPALLVLGSNASEQDLQLFREQYGLDKSLPEQYLNYMKNVLKGDFGTSYATKQRVMDMVGVRIGNTLTLCAGAVALIAILGIVLGVCMALKQNSIFDNIARVLVLFFSAMPQFWLGMMLILLFCVQLKLLPSSGMESFKAAILPVICTAMGGVTVVSRTSRSSMLEVIHQDYIRTDCVGSLFLQAYPAAKGIFECVQPFLCDPSRHLYRRFMSFCIKGLAVSSGAKTDLTHKILLSNSYFIRGKPGLTLTTPFSRSAIHVVAVIVNDLISNSAETMLRFIVSLIIRFLKPKLDDNLFLFR